MALEAELKGKLADAQNEKDSLLKESQDVQKRISSAEEKAKKAEDSFTNQNADLERSIIEKEEALRMAQEELEKSKQLESSL